MKHRILCERVYGLEQWRLIVWAWDGAVLLNVTRMSEQGARIALMQFEHKNGAVK